MSRVSHFLPMILLSSLVVGCSGAVEAAPPLPSPDPTPTVIEAIGVDWNRDDVEVTLSDRWTVRGCEGDAPLLCVFDGDRLAGDVELGQFSAGSDLLDTVDLPTALRAHADDFLQAMEDDRAIGCADFSFEAMAVTDTDVGGEPAVRTGFVLRDDQGRQVERVVVHVTVRGETMWTVNASAYVQDGGCLPAEQDFEPATLEEFEPYLDAIVRGTPIPEDGDV